MAAKKKTLGVLVAITAAIAPGIASAGLNTTPTISARYEDTASASPRALHAIASGDDAANPKTRVRGFEVADYDSIGLHHVVSHGLHLEKPILLRRSASRSPLVPGGGGYPTPSMGALGPAPGFMFAQSVAMGAHATLQAPGAALDAIDPTGRGILMLSATTSVLPPVGDELIVGGLGAFQSARAAEASMIGARAGMVARPALQAARAGRRHGGALRLFLAQTNAQLIKGLGSFNRLASQHRGWIASSR